ncbi:hypothetical protein MS2017_0948 [Bathymodiolus thermophilus thioautotrophic gill symbiont]|uniref:S1/P1 Nuclease n=1 Tax=Bathymodiolus thermophilus thioautotrophic gill symbiont TaxID=2360 RepID=A0A3G3ILE2_9GAMM|nr:S1/P1 nuclease [Bathymodiolus thermophilus thioautotrophic gill symbiont]AYQ56667.1 hypothetical protein MS2017_0948 [Bathymodiolus thermophilus thioautotrophic gill symbiont]CAB5503107.1 hypothetical protein THERMOS_1731 [Bathymodiolus thermophilus thioautotrophic gill symbiont]
MKKIIYVLIFQSLLFAPSMVKAYGLEGHISILHIALNQLSAEKRAKITPLLSDILDQIYDSEKSLDPVISANWLDNMYNIEILNKAHFSGKIIHNPQKIKLPKNAEEVLFYKLDVYWNLDEIKYAFKQHKKDPKDNPLSTFKQSLLLMYLVHLVGDAHQPLHVTEPLYGVYRTNTNPYGETYGANSVLVKTSGKCLGTKKLHAIWDGMGCLTDAARKKYPPRTGTEQEYFINAEKFFAKNLVKDFVANIVKKATIDPKKYQMDFDTKTWVNDLQKFDSNVFAAIDADIAKLKHSTDAIVLTDEYLKNVEQTTINLVYLAGLRLGYILNSIY